MKNNLFASQTIQYILSHPNCKNNKIQSLSKFIGWQFYKRLTQNYLDINLIPEVKMRCYPDSYSASAALYCGLYDYDEMSFLLRYLRSEDIFLDIGANIGVYTLLAASKLDQGQIYSIEALPKNFIRLEENLAINRFSNVKTYQIAVSDTEGRISLNLAEGDSMPFITVDRTENSISVLTSTLDNLMINHEKLENLTLAKIDIEGAEMLAFKGAHSLLKRQIPYVWILEINDTVNNFGHQKQDVVDLLNQYNYELYDYDANLNQISKANLDDRQSKNVFAIAKSALNFVHSRLEIG